MSGHVRLQVCEMVGGPFDGQRVVAGPSSRYFFACVAAEGEWFSPDAVTPDTLAQRPLATEPMIGVFEYGGIVSKKGSLAGDGTDEGPTRKEGAP